MASNDGESTSLWTNSSISVLDAVMKAGHDVHVTCTRHVKGGYEDVAIKGQLLKVSGCDIVLGVEEVRAQPGKDTGRNRVCGVSFILDRPTEEGGVERIGYHGRGVLQDEFGTGESGLHTVSIHMSTQMATRKLRKDDRLTWDAQWTKLFCLCLVDEHPVHTEDIHRIVSTQYHKEIPIILRDISAGGASVTIDRLLDHADLSSNDLRLFFLVPADIHCDKPYALLGKKVGTLRGAQPEESILRLRFLSEIDWEKSGHALVWTDIKRTGSVRMRSLVERLMLESAPYVETETETETTETGPPPEDQPKQG
ncbi:MAG: hypothetical protein LBR22_05050 [Desulfovibrio sp.]|jgi:hypothetical protein|nr:hypothetical protein [Desulfovibrio sp.]